jgi:transposase
MDETILVIATVGIYRCACGPSFTYPLSEAPPKGDYSYRVRQKALEGLVNDSMTLSQTRERLWRDFHVIVSIGTLHAWHVSTGLKIDMKPYERWAAENFSGVVCIDEVYDDACCVLIATDPLNDIPIAYVIAERADRCTKEDAEKLFEKLNAILPGPPEVVITDGSPLYKALVLQTWPGAHHQLCYFHVIKDICAEVLRAVREVREPLESNVSRIKEALDKSYAKAARRAMLDVEGLPSDKSLLAQRRYLLVKQEGRLSKAESLLLKAMKEAYPALGDYRAFMSDVYCIFARRVTKRKAWARRKKLLDNPVYARYSRLVTAMKKLGKDVFKKLVSYLGYTNVPRTNNHVEGVNRKFRKQQKTCYKRRVKDTIRAALNHFLVYSARKHLLYDESYGPAIVIPARSTA